MSKGLVIAEGDTVKFVHESLPNIRFLDTVFTGIVVELVTG